ncbi:RidA family protein [Nocardioides sp.]|uniref:RidA family protein n=1 Tax=Nocardioides sp. TaxID=35761 RepID=UPI003D0E5A13
MSRRRVIELPNISHAAPIPTATVIGNFLASSAIFGADQATGTLPHEPEVEIACLFENVNTVLTLAGGSLADVLRMDVFVRDNVVRDLINKEWMLAFPDERDRPARHITVITALPALAQIEMIAVLPAEASEKP